MVTEMATPTAALARVSKARIPATPAASATAIVEPLHGSGTRDLAQRETRRQVVEDVEKAGDPRSADEAETARPRRGS